MTIKVGINGFGRIGRLVFRVMMERENFEVAAVNDLADAEAMAYLLKYDSVHGRYPGEVAVDGENLVVDGKRIPVLSVKDPKELPWGEMGVYFALESTGVFRNRSSEKGGYGDHITAGAKKVLLSVPAKDKVDATIVLGVNDDALAAEHTCISNASCTTNCLAPIAKVLHDNFTIKHGLMTTCHGYTNDQTCCDQIHSDPARGRAAAAVNIIPTSTGAAKALGEVIPDLKGKLNGIALRVPVAHGSVVDLVTEVEKDISVEAVNAAMKRAAEGPMKGILGYTEDPIVSSDAIHSSLSSLFSARQTMVIDGMVKLISWYDNEWGYSNRVVDLMEKAAGL